MDESGHFHAGDYTVVMAILATTTPKEIALCIKHTRQRKLGKQRKTLPELRAHDLTPQVLRFALRKLSRCDCQIYSILAMGTGIHPGSSPNVLYNEVASVLIRECRRRIQMKELVVDRRADRKARFQFDEHIRTVLGEELVIRHEDSRDEPALQGVDLVASAIRQKAQHNHPEFYNLIQRRMVWEGIFQA